jgi:hypothetical protein
LPLWPRSSASSDGKTTTRQVGRTIQGWRTCGLTIFRGIGVFAACRSLLPFAFDRVTHDLLERCARREREASLEQYCAGYAICACDIRHRPFRPIRLRMVERVLAGDAITLAGRSCRPSCADWSACTLHLPSIVNAESTCVSSSSWMTSGRPPPVAYACGSMRSVRSSHDFSQELPLPAASHDVRYVLRMR